MMTHTNTQSGIRACCVLKECSEETCMALPSGKTCDACARFSYCSTIWGQKPDCNICGYFPRRFNEVASMLTYMDNWFGLVDRKNDLAYTMDDFGNAVEVPFCLPSNYWQEV